MEIKILPSNVANMIAAGEVVQRPSSVVKELMENAVDAGATRVKVVIRDAGKTLIQVIDNGCGMTADEAELAFQRHATSKISDASDLMSLHTFGFRGEALPSIAAVSQVKLKTRTADEETGWTVEFEDSKHISTTETATPVGCNFEVRNLFYNVPARRKFLKSDNVEMKHITEEFVRVALTRYDVDFTLVHNDRELYVLKAANSMKFRIQEIVGPAAASELLDVNAKTSAVTVRGYAARPDKCRKSPGNQFFFVNGRYFRSPYLHKAVMKAYEKLISSDAIPSYFLYLDVDTSAVDVNVHPSKTEIKFEDDSVIFQVLYACLRECLGKSSFVGSIDFDEVPGAIPQVSRSFDEFNNTGLSAMGPEIGSGSGDYNPFDIDGLPNEQHWVQQQFENGAAFPQQSSAAYVNGVKQYDGASDSMQSAKSCGQIYDENLLGVQQSSDGKTSYGQRFDTQNVVDRRQDYGALMEDKLQPSRQIMILHGKFIVTPSRSGLMVINIRRARERVLNDRFLAAFSQNAHNTQKVLFPVTLRIGVENVLLLDEYADMLSKAGFDISKFGEDTVVVNGVPDGYSAQEGDIETMVSDLLLILNDSNPSLTELLNATMAEKFARLGASNAEAVTTSAQAQCLIDSLFACANPDYTASGRKVMIIIPDGEIDRRF